MNPEASRKQSEKMKKYGESRLDFYDHIHPNCLCFSDGGRLFAGGSDGVVTSWDVVIRDMTIKTENHFKIAHRELEGDQINSIENHPLKQN